MTASSAKSANGSVRKLLVRLGLLALAILLTGLAISQYDTRVADDNYLAAVLEKDRLIRSTPSPKVILVGGSNLAFGIDSRMMQDSLGIRVVNMGLYARLGLRYMLAQVRPYIQPGDVVVVVPEYDQFYGTFSNGDNTLNTALLYAPSDRISDFIRSYSIIDVLLRPRVENARRSFLRLAAATAGRETQFFPPDTNPVYNRKSFNAFGDVVSHIGKQPMHPDSIFVSRLPPQDEFNDETIEDLNEIAERVAEQRASAYFMFPSYIDRSYAINVAAIDSLSSRLARDMRIPIAGTPRDFVYRKELFFDTRYHLNAEGRALRTLQMIRTLRSLPAFAGRE